MKNRINFNDDGTLDEVVTDGGAHLEQLRRKSWWLNCVRSDGSSFCVWFKGKVTMTEEREHPGPAPDNWIHVNEDTLQERLRATAYRMNEQFSPWGRRVNYADLLTEAADALDARDKEREQFEIRIRSLLAQNEMKY